MGNLSTSRATLKTQLFADASTSKPFHSHFHVSFIFNMKNVNKIERKLKAYDKKMTIMEISMGGRKR